MKLKVDKKHTFAISGNQGLCASLDIDNGETLMSKDSSALYPGSRPIRATMADPTENGKTKKLGSDLLVAADDLLVASRR